MLGKFFDMICKIVFDVGVLVWVVCGRCDLFEEKCCVFECIICLFDIEFDVEVLMV